MDCASEQPDAGRGRVNKMTTPLRISRPTLSDDPKGIDMRVLLRAGQSGGSLALSRELSKSLESITVPAGQYLFRVGDQDEYVHVVQSGRMDVHIVDDDNR